MITQTGGGCRASNYIHLLRKALVKAGFSQVPVISLNLSGLEKNSGFSFTLPMIRKTVAGLVYGDMLMLLKNQTKAYEIKKGESEKLVKIWVNKLTDILNKGDGYTVKQIEKNLEDIAKDFSNIKLNRVPKVKAGIVGEIYVKYAKLGNNNLEAFLEEQNCEVCVPGIMSFALFKIDNRLEDIKLYGGSKIKYKVAEILFDYVLKMENILIEKASAYGFNTPSGYYKVIGYGNKMGEGWLLTAEMLELTETGYENIVCAQPFGCLPNHICAKGMMRKIKEVDNRANIVAIDYDPGAVKVNQENRIKLMLAVAKENLAKKTEPSQIKQKELVHKD